MELINVLRTLDPTQLVRVIERKSWPADERGQYTALCAEVAEVNAIQRNAFSHELAKERAKHERILGVLAKLRAAVKGNAEAESVLGEVLPSEPAPAIDAKLAAENAALLRERDELRQALADIGAMVTDKAVQERVALELAKRAEDKAKGKKHKREEAPAA